VIGFDRPARDLDRVHPRIIDTFHLRVTQGENTGHNRL
jgi:hypothetical protein